MTELVTDQAVNIIRLVDDIDPKLRELLDRTLSGLEHSENPLQDLAVLAITSYMTGYRDNAAAVLAESKGKKS